MTAFDTTTLPAGGVGTWRLDPDNTTIEIHTKAMWGMANVKVVFKAVGGTGRIGVDGAISGDLVVSASSIATKNKKRDEHLRSAEFFDASTYPTFSFITSEVTASPDGTLKIKGTLLIKEQSRSIDVVAIPKSSSPDRVTMNAETTIDRRDWGMTWAKMGARLVNRVVVVAEFVRS